MRILTLLAIPMLALGLAGAVHADEAPEHVKAAAKAAPDGEVYALFIDVKGKVKWRANAEAAWQDAKVDDRLPVGGEVRTGLNGSRTTLRVGLNATVLIDSGSVFSIPMSVKDGDQLRTLAGLKSGRADFKVENTGLGADFKVATPSSVLAVRGTGFAVNYGALKGAEISGARTNAMRAIELRYALGNMTYFLSGQARSSLAMQNPVKHALLTAIGPPPLGGGQTEAEREQTLTQQQTGTVGNSPDSLQAQQNADATQSGRGDASSARQQYFIALEQSLLTQLEFAGISDRFDQCSAEFETVQQSEEAMAVLEDARDRAVDGAAEGETVAVEVSEGRAGMLADRDAVFVGFQDELTDAELTALVAAVESSTDLFGDRAARLVELGELVGAGRTDAEAAFAAAQGAEGSFAGALALLESLVPQIDQGNTSILGYQQIAQAALEAVQALYATTRSAEIDSTLAETLFELAAIAERAAESAEFLAQAEEQLATSQSYAERLAIGRAIELQQQAIDADVQMQLLLDAAGDLVSESALAQQAFVELDRAIDAMVLSRANAVASLSASEQAHDAIGTLFGNHQLAVQVASNFITWQDGVAGAESSRIAAEGFRDTAVFNRDLAQTSYESVLALAAARDWEGAYNESLATAGFASLSGAAAAGAAQAAVDANDAALAAAGAGGQLVASLGTAEGLAAYEADAAAALAAAGAEPSENDPDGEGVLGQASVLMDQAQASIESAQVAQGQAVDAVSAYGGQGGDVLEPNNALDVLAGQIQEAIDDLQAASEQYAQLQAYAQTWATRIVLDNIQTGIATALANAGSAATAAQEAQQAAAEAQQFADDAATAAVPPGDGQP
ncbi:MAG: hypothetical protein RLZZ246_170 [Planctomycetota bacterium]